VLTRGKRPRCVGRPSRRSPTMIWATSPAAATFNIFRWVPCQLSH
jgi:hypothetical protein